VGVGGWRITGPHWSGECFALGGSAEPKSVSCRRSGKAEVCSCRLPFFFYDYLAYRSLGVTVCDDRVQCPTSCNKAYILLTLLLLNSMTYASYPYLFLLLVLSLIVQFISNQCKTTKGDLDLPI